MIKNLLLRYGLLAVVLLMGIDARADEKEREFMVFDASNGMADNSAQTIKCTKTGRMVITTIGHINFYDGSSFSHIDPTRNDVFPLPKYTGHYHLYFDRYHHLWLKDKNQVTCVDLLTERFIPDVRGVIASLGMNQKVDDLFGDQNGYMWFLSGRSLYCKEQKKVMPVAFDEPLQDVDVYDDRTLLEFFSNGVVSAYDLSTGRHLYHAPAYTDADTARYATSSVICPYKTGFYQIRNGDAGGLLLYFDAETVEWRKIMQTPYHLNNMDVHDNCVYIACEYGYWVYDMRTREATHIEELKLTKGRSLKTDVNTLAFDRQGGMWIGTERRGILYAKPFRSPFHSYAWSDTESTRYYQLMADRLQQATSLPRHVNCIYRDSRGWTWTGTYTGLLLDRPHGNRRTILRRDGLMNEMVHSVVEDHNHDIWASTSFGISHLFIRGDSVYHIESYFHQDNVPNESFVNGMAACLADGTVVMQSLDHMVTFHPADFHHDSISHIVLYPKLTKLMVNGREIKAGEAYDGKVILKRAITRTREVSVNYNQNSMSLTFSGLNYLRPIQTYYRVRVKGVHDKWRVFSYYEGGGLVDSRGMLHLPLFGLRPGKYEIELQASLAPDVWPLDPYVWVVNVEEPWWRTTGVYITLVLLLGALLGANFFFYNRNTRLRMVRNNEEADILRRIKAYVEQCATFDGEVLTPYSSVVGESADMSKEFMEAMLAIVPYVRERQGKPFTMGDLSVQTGISVSKLYELLSANIYKSPRPLVSRLRLQEAARLLQTTELTIEDIADRMGFVSANYFIASFYHQYRQTPQDYRSSIPR